MLVLAWHGEPGDGLGERDPELPQGVRPLGLISLRDILRPEAKDTLERFANAGVTVRIISGDDPETVATLVRQAGVKVDRDVISGADLEALEPARVPRGDRARPDLRARQPAAQGADRRRAARRAATTSRWSATA